MAAPTPTTQGSGNYRGLKNPAVDALLEAMDKAQTMDELRDAARALDRVIIFGFYQVPDLYLAADRVSRLGQVRHSRDHAQVLHHRVTQRRLGALGHHGVVVKDAESRHVLQRLRPPSKVPEQPRCSPTSASACCS